MKKIALLLSAMTTVVLTATSCTGLPGATPASGTPTSGTPTSGTPATGDLFASKQVFINYFTCILNKTTDPAQKTSVQAVIDLYNSIPDTYWSMALGSMTAEQKSSYLAWLNNTAATGCKI